MLPLQRAGPLADHRVAASGSVACCLWHPKRKVVLGRVVLEPRRARAAVPALAMCADAVELRLVVAHRDGEHDGREGRHVLQLRRRRL